MITNSLRTALLQSLTLTWINRSDGAVDASATRQYEGYECEETSRGLG